MSDENILNYVDCGRCYACIGNQPTLTPGITLGMTRMIVCSECGNKRCPHGTDHRYTCTGSNEPNQSGSRYGGELSPGSIGMEPGDNFVAPTMALDAYEPEPDKDRFEFLMAERARIDAELRRFKKDPTECQECGTRDLAYDYEAVVTINLKDGEPDRVVLGGVLGSDPRNVLCAEGHEQLLSYPDDDGVLVSAVEDGLLEKLSTVLDDLLPDGLNHSLNNGWCLFERKGKG